MTDRQPVGRRATSSLVIVAIVATIVGGCIGSGGDTGRLRAQAEAALARWADAVAAAGGPSAVVPVGELTNQVGDWEAEVGSNNKPALMGGLVQVAGALPADTPPDGDVTWADGTSVRVPLLSAEQAVAAIRTGALASCDDCTALRITDAQLSTGPIETSRGPATAPVWQFTIEGTAVKVARLAIANRVVTVVPPPWNPNDPAQGVWLDSVHGSASGQELEVAFTGSPQPGNEPCGEDYTTEVVESDLAVVVIVLRHPHLTLGGCAAVGARRTAIAELAAPLDDRAVLQVYDGTPVRTVLAP